MSGSASTIAMMLSVCLTDDSMLRVTWRMSCQVWFVASFSSIRAER
jgi:hypothetical protein